MAWSQVPQICFSAAMLLILLGIGVWQAFIPSLPDPNARYRSRSKSVHANAWRRVIISIWSFILMLHCVGEVHRFSAWRALGAFLLPGALFLGI